MSKTGYIPLFSSLSEWTLRVVKEYTARASIYVKQAPAMPSILNARVLEDSFAGCRIVALFTLLHCSKPDNLKSRRA